MIKLIFFGFLCAIFILGVFTLILLYFENEIKKFEKWKDEFLN